MQCDAMITTVNQVSNHADDTWLTVVNIALAKVE